MKRRRGVKMAFLLVGLCAGLAGVAGGYDRVAGVMASIRSKIPFAGVEAPGAAATGEFRPEVLMNGLTLAASTPAASIRSSKPTPGTVIFGPGGNGPEIDASKMLVTRTGAERPAVKSSSVVVVRESDGITSHR